MTTTDRKHREPLLLGVAISVYQNSGGPGSNWAHFESRRRLRGPTIAGGQRAGLSGDFWNLYRQDIALARHLGCNAFRLSVEWSRIEPRQGVVDEEAVRRYREILGCIRDHGMEPMATLHHFVHPQWFELLGGFERAANLPLFVRHCARAVELFGDRVRLWATINEPTVMSFLGYILGAHCPGVWLRPDRAFGVLANLMRAHCDAYRAIKALPRGRQAAVGIVHSLLDFLPRAVHLVHAALLARAARRLFAHEEVLRFFETGHLCLRSPWGRLIELRDRAPLDFIGLNYYSRIVLGADLRPTGMPGERMTDMPYAFYPEGLHEAIVRVARLGVPVYVTENGIADRLDDRRADYIRYCLAQFERALDEGYDLRGYFYWTLVDNFEWNLGYQMKFGLYELDQRTQKRRYRPGAEALREAYARLAQKKGPVTE